MPVGMEMMEMPTRALAHCTLAGSGGLGITAAAAAAAAPPRGPEAAAAAATAATAAFLRAAGETAAGVTLILGMNIPISSSSPSSP